MARKDLHAPDDGLVKQAHRGLDARSMEKIGNSLKAHYDDLVRTPVPQKFLELLNRLEANERIEGFGSTSDEPG